MRKHVLILICAAWLTGSLVKAQDITPQTLGVAGGEFANSSFSVSFTFGEMIAVKTIGSSSMITQGFHQPMADTASNSITEKLTELDGVILYPNPTTGIVYLDVSALDGRLNYELYSAAGSTIRSGIHNAPQVLNLDLRHLERGLYILRVQKQVDQSSTPRSFKINLTK